MVIEEMESLGDALLGTAPRDPDGFLAQFETIVRHRRRVHAGRLRERTRSTRSSTAWSSVIEEQATRRSRSRDGEEAQRLIERLVLMRTIDTLWVQHLTADR